MRSINKYLLFGIIFFIIFVLIFFKLKQKSSIYTAQDYIIMAKYFNENKDKKRAMKFYKKSLDLDPTNSFVLVRLASEYFNMGEYDKSLIHFEKAYKIIPEAVDLLYQMGRILYLKKGDLVNAIKKIEKHNRFCKDNVRAYITLYDCYVKLGDFKKARESQKKKDEVLIAKGIVNKLKKEWDGFSSIKNKTILLRDNVGIGDIFCWLRYVKKLKLQGAKIILETRKFLIPILEKLGCIDSFVVRGDKLPEFDYQITVGRMPDFFLESQDDLRTEIPYMKADERLEKKWHMKLSKDKNFKIGICWDPCKYKNSKGEYIKNKRALPLSFLLPLSRLKNISLYSLQCVNGTEQMDGILSDFKINTFGKNFDKLYGSFTDTAAVIKNLDLVITVDTSIAHLAGALGAPVWVLLPFVADWRWLLDEHKTVLYPTMRLFRQDKLDNWESVINRVCNDLSRYTRN